MTVKEALEAVVKESNQPYAITYAKTALENGDSQATLLVQNDKLPGVLLVEHERTDKMMVGEEMRVQLLYVLGNLSCWRGPRAREVKEVLKNASKAGKAGEK